METLKNRLLDLFRKKSYQFRNDPPFTLASGRKSPHYVDCKPTMHDPEGKELIGNIIFDLIKNEGVDAVGGLTMGADPIAISASLISYQKKMPIKSFSVRKDLKDHGTKKRIEGDMHPGERVVIVDDVITTGGSVIDAIIAVQEYGLEIVKVIVLVDREEGGREKIENFVPRVESVFTLSQLKDSENHANHPTKRPSSSPVRSANTAV
jgi:orotate phosphoribosyltransferase